jgi:hypothetical protein
MKKLEDFIIAEALKIIKENNYNISIKNNDSHLEDVVNKSFEEDVVGMQFETVEAKEFEEDVKEANKLVEELDRMKELLSFKKSMLKN